MTGLVTTGLGVARRGRRFRRVCPPASITKVLTSKTRLTNNALCLINLFCITRSLKQVPGMVQRYALSRVAIKPPLGLYSRYTLDSAFRS